MMEGDELLEPLRSFTERSLGLSEPAWRQFLMEEENQLLLGSFFSTADCCDLFLHREPPDGLSAGLHFPTQVRTKVVCVSRKSRQVITKENLQKLLLIQEVQGEDVMSFLTSVSEVTCPLLSNPESSVSWAGGVADEALSFMERQKNEALVMSAQTKGQSFLPPPDGLHGDKGKLSDVKLLHACDWTVIEWAELVSDFLQRDSSAAAMDGSKPLPSEEFNFWQNRLKNLLFIQQQLTSRRALQVASIVEKTQSVYWSTLRDIYRDVQEGLQEAEDVTVNLSPVQQQLEELQQQEYQQLGSRMAAVMEEVRLLWIRSEFYCKPCRVVVLLQEVCNLLIHRSRTFLRGQEVMRGLVTEPGAVLDDVTLVIWTLQKLKEAFSQTRTQLEAQQQDGDTHSCWDFPSHLVFIHLDKFLQRLQSIQEVFRVGLQMSQLSPAVLSGVSGGMWTDVVQQVYQDFVCHVTVLSDCPCDPTDPDDQTFQLHHDQFQAQVSDLDRRLVSVLSRALEACSVSSSAAKLVKMFRFVLERPLILDQLRPHLVRLGQMVLEEVDQTELLFHSEREKSHTLSRFTPTAATRLCWTQQLRLRAEDTLNHYRTIQHLDLDPGESQLVLQRVQQIVDLLQDFRDGLRSDWSSQLDSDCGFILDQPLIQHDQQGMLGVSCSRQLEAALRELRCVSRETDVELRPHASRLFACRDDITRSYLSLSHMVSCYNQVVSGVLQVELPLIQDQLQDLNRTMSELQRNTWSCAGVQQLVEQQKQAVLMLHSTVSEARANMDAMTHIIQGWAELHLLRRSGDSLLEGGATEQSYGPIREQGQELLRLTQVNRTVYGVEDSSESWIRYLDHIDDRVQNGLFQLLLRTLHFLSDNMNPQSCSGVFLGIRLQLQETGSEFEPSVSVGLSDLLKNVISGIYGAASLLPRISVVHHSNYQMLLHDWVKLSYQHRQNQAHGFLSFKGGTTEHSKYCYIKRKTYRTHN
ncbi:dynein axonemal heavy chain 17-like isoform X2 [Centropristis striata]|uniref:dynein axonemal heavy chain 17-like isoform X2 n=1 Tax=Centropristis striata TaxID=184440 RepID=UPI0027DF2177|nr:dynein axonemal heavy chain 17-like isoform X2 [Centropristis striata]